MSKSIKPPKGITPKQVDSIIGHHLPYEVQMMRYLLKELPSGSYEQLIHNSNIQSFHLNARNIIEFLKNKNDIDPRIYTDETFKIDRQFPNTSLTNKMNAQISHVTWGRTKVEKDKLGPELWPELSEVVEEHIARFVETLTPDYRKLYEAGLEMFDFGRPAERGPLAHVRTQHSRQRLSRPSPQTTILSNSRRTKPISRTRLSDLPPSARPPVG